MESDLNEMEVQLGHANKQAAESQRIIRHLQTQVAPSDPNESNTKTIKLYFRTSFSTAPVFLLRSSNGIVFNSKMFQVKEQQVELEDKVQLTNQLREQIVLLERRCSLMTAEEEELREILEQTDRARKMAEHELVEVAERVNLLTTQVHTQTDCRLAD